MCFTVYWLSINRKMIFFTVELVEHLQVNNGNMLRLSCFDLLHSSIGRALPGEGCTDVEVMLF